LTAPTPWRSLGLDAVTRCRLLALAALLSTAALAAGGCTMTPTASPRSTIEQRLLSRSLERALAKIDVTPFKGKRVFVDLTGLTPDQVYARTYVSSELRQRGVLVVSDASESEVRLQVMAPGLGVDQGETLIGIPATTVPVLSVAIPEIPIFRWVRHRGVTEVKFYAYDNQDGRPFEVAPSALGHSRYSQFTILIIIRWTTDDLDDPPPAEPPPAASPR
jgi:hypothetical protein